MSDENKLTANEPETTKPDERLGRRLFFFKAAAVLGGAAVVTTVASVAAPTEAQAQWCTDRDPGDPRGRGRWCRRRRWCTDRDPYDPRGRGIRCRRW